MTQFANDDVICTYCGEGYAIGNINRVVSRRGDCNIYYTPCCDRLVDDREWKTLPAFQRCNDIPRVNAFGFVDQRLVRYATKLRAASEADLPFWDRARMTAP